MDICIKAIKKGQATAIIALIASSLAEEQTVVFSMGCDDFIHKPFQEAEIFETLHKHIGVSFVYDEPTAAPLNTETPTDISIPTALATIPVDLVSDFHQALLELDVEMIKTSIAQICSLNEPLGDAIAALANNFQYEQLLKLISLR